MTTLELVTALEEGKLLMKDAYMEDKNSYELEECISYLFREDYKGFKMYNAKGWGSFNNKDKFLLELFDHPEYWAISLYKVEDRPWNKNTRQSWNEYLSK